MDKTNNALSIFKDKMVAKYKNKGQDIRDWMAVQLDRMIKIRPMPAESLKS